MPSLKEVRNRITSVNSTQQITKAMKMVAAAKLRKSQEAIIQLRPYSQKLSGIIANVSSAKDESFSNPYAVKRDENKVLVIVVTSDRGLCGGFNTNIFKAVNQLIENKYASQHAKGNLSFLTIGKKGNEYLLKRGYNVDSRFFTLFGKLSFENTREIAETVMASFVNGDYDKVEVVYNEFKNVATQIVQTEQFLPIAESTQTSAASDVEYIYEPSKIEILTDLLPKSLKIQLYKAVLDSAASENGARMTAMDKATENAGELLKALKLTYNRSRQAAITKEILEIVGGAEALSK
ncbi:MAG: synthase subunit gamma [Bacteroidota bacterium]|jgi:F-type H+-transporting ATPase subunit gamma